MAKTEKSMWNKLDLKISKQIRKTVNLLSVFTFCYFVFRDVQTLQPESCHWAGPPHGHPEAVHHHRVPPGIFGVSDQRHWQGMANRGQAAATFATLCLVSVKSVASPLAVIPESVSDRSSFRP